jgi:hypothetical protein
MGQIQGVKCAIGSGPQGRDTVSHVVSWSSRRREVKEIINVAIIKRLAYVQLIEFKMRIPREVLDVIQAPSK